MQVLIEVIACSVEDAIEAERGGAGRLEVARDMQHQGLTPPVSLVHEIAAAVRVPLRVMVRENSGFECTGADELSALCEAARAFAGIEGVEGLVLGFIRNDAIDHETLAAVLGSAPHLRATFHRGFDMLPDPRAAIEGLKQHHQVDRILSGGASGAWPERCRQLSALADLAQPEILILPGGGVDVDAVCHISRTRGLSEAHVGRAVREPREVWGRVSASLVRELREAGSSQRRP